MDIVSNRLTFLISALLLFNCNCIKINSLFLKLDFLLEYVIGVLFGLSTEINVSLISGYSRLLLRPPSLDL